MVFVSKPRDGEWPCVKPEDAAESVIEVLVRKRRSRDLGRLISSSYCNGPRLYPRVRVGRNPVIVLARITTYR